MISTTRFLLLWVAVSLPLPLAQRLLFPLTPESRMDTTRVVVGIGLAGLALAGSAFLQGRLLARHRRPVRFWTAAAVAGWVMSMLASASLSLQLFRSRSGLPEEGFLRAYQIVSTSSAALCFAAPKALALWGFQRQSKWILWLSGHLVLSLGLLLVNQVLGTLGPLLPGAKAALPVLFAAVSAAATAWMLDLLAFPRTPDPGSQEEDPS